MTQRDKDEIREERIMMEIVVDCCEPQAHRLVYFRRRIL